MAVEYTEAWTERHLNRTVDDSGHQQWTADRGWDVVGATTETEAINAVPDAQLDAPHDQAPIMTVRTNDAKPRGLDVWRVLAKYDIKPQNNTSALKDPAQYSFTETEEMIPTDRDWQGDAIVNSAGEAFDSGGFLPLKTFIYEITLNQPFYDANIAAQYLNALNDGSFKTPFGTYQKGEVYFNSCLPTDPFLLKDKYVRTKYSFKIRLKANFPNIPDDASPFDTRYLDKGRNARCITVATGKLGLAQIVDLEGRPVGQDVRLNGRGIPVDSAIAGNGKDGNYNILTGSGKDANKAIQKMKMGQEPKGPIIEKPRQGADVKAYFLWYRQYRYIDFGQLKLSIS